MKDKYACLDEEKKTAKAVRILKTVFNGLKKVHKWSKQSDLTVGQVIKWGFIFLIAATMVKAAIFG